MKGMSLFSTDEWMLLISARFVNVLLGALTAWVVLKTAKLLFPRRYAWMFTTLVVFLPGNVILYSYVNCDALAMCSTAIIFYSWVKAYKEGWSWTTCAVSAVGMGICFLSYYNAYGFILMTFFYFVGTMLTDQSKPVKERWKEMIQKGLFILVIVCVIALWWFIRNAILYGGDFLGRQASSASAELYARYQYKPPRRMRRSPASPRQAPKCVLFILYPTHYVKMCSRCSILPSHSLLESAHSFSSVSISAFIGRFFL